MDVAGAATSQIISQRADVPLELVKSDAPVAARVKHREDFREFGLETAWGVPRPKQKVTGKKES